MTRPLKTGFSTCPNDTFVFDAILHRRIDTGNFLFEPLMNDVEELNRIAAAEGADVIKVSCAHLPALSDRYVVLTAGAALGYKCGPLIVGNDPEVMKRLNAARVAIPGSHTTANFLLSRFFPEVSNKVTMLFSDIEDAILNGEVDAGVIIHESRFTYRSKGLSLLADLGEAWHNQTGLPLPLGCIVASSGLPSQQIRDVNRMLRTSVEYAMKNPNDSAMFVKKHAQTMENEVINQHIALYVNQLTVDMGAVGKNAIKVLIGASPAFADEI
jgi:1,4-dihydroxy-6-naphthoate synthase